MFWSKFPLFTLTPPKKLKIKNKQKTFSGLFFQASKFPVESRAYIVGHTSRTHAIMALKRLKEENCRSLRSIHVIPWIAGQLGIKISFNKQITRTKGFRERQMEIFFFVRNYFFKAFLYVMCLSVLLPICTCTTGIQCRWRSEKSEELD